MSNSEFPSNTSDFQPPVPDVHQQVKDIFTDRAVVDAISGARQDVLDNRGKDHYVNRRQEGRFASAAFNALDDLRLSRTEIEESPKGATPLPKRTPAKNYGNGPSGGQFKYYLEWDSQGPRLWSDDER